MIEFNKKKYFDDRMYVFYFGRGRPEFHYNLVFAKIFYKKPPDDALWCIVQHENCDSYAPIEIYFFVNKNDAIRFLKQEKPRTLLISNNGDCPQKLLQYEEYLRWEKENKMKKFNWKLVKNVSPYGSVIGAIPEKKFKGIMSYDNEYNGDAICYKDTNGKEFLCEYSEYYENGNIKNFYSKHRDGKEYWEKYNKKGNIKEVEFKDPDGFDKLQKYDEKGNVIYIRRGGDHEQWLSYDEKGNEVYGKGNDGVEWWNEYDSEGNLIHFKNNFGGEDWHKYDEKGNKINSKTCLDSKKCEEWIEYDEEGREIYYKDSDGCEEWREYNEKGQLLYYKNQCVKKFFKERYLDNREISIVWNTNDGPRKFEEWYEYDEFGTRKKLKRREANFYEYKEYDVDGNLIYDKNSKTRLERSYDKNGNLKKHS